LGTLSINDSLVIIVQEPFLEEFKMRYRAIADVINKEIEMGKNLDHWIW
jgi:hypothetical protein